MGGVTPSRIFFKFILNKVVFFGWKSFGYQTRTRIRLIDMIFRSGSTNQNDYNIGTCNYHELLFTIM